MKVTLGQLRRFIREAWAGSHPSEAYDELLIDDPTFDSESVMVPDDIKRVVKRWSKDMGLSRKKRK